MEFHEILLSPTEYFEYLEEKGEFPSSYQVPKTVLIVFQKVALQHLLSQHNHHFGKRFLSKVAFFDKLPIAVCGGFGVGAPALAVKIEELIAWGVKRFVTLGTGAILTSDVPLQALALGEKVFGVDGISKYYSDMEKGLLIDHAFKQQFISYAKKEGLYPLPVTVMSTDLFFGTAKQDENKFQREKADLLDMETAAFYAICKKREVLGLSLYVTANSLSADDWIIGFDAEETIAELKKAVDFAFRFCVEST